MLFFFSSSRRHTRCSRDWSSDVCSSDLRYSSRICTSAKSGRQRTSAFSPSSRKRRAAPRRSTSSATSSSTGSATTTSPSRSRSEERRVGKECRSRWPWCCCNRSAAFVCCFFFQAADGIRDVAVTGVQTCALPICVIHLGSAPQRRAAGSERALFLLPRERGARRRGALHPRRLLRVLDRRRRPRPAVQDRKSVV